MVTRRNGRSCHGGAGFPPAHSSGTFEFSFANVAKRHAINEETITNRLRRMHEVGFVQGSGKVGDVKMPTLGRLRSE